MTDLYTLESLAVKNGIDLNELVNIATNEEELIQLISDKLETKLISHIETLSHDDLRTYALSIGIKKANNPKYKIGADYKWLLHAVKAEISDQALYLIQFVVVN
jgi:ethanolamine ammonia-lyase large subunit